MMFDAQQIKANQARMERERSGFDSLRSEIATLVLPQAEYDQHWGHISPAPDSTKQYDEYAALALEDGVSGFEGFVMPRGQKWQGITIIDEELKEDILVQRWFAKIAALIFAFRNDPRSGFVDATHSGIQSLYAFGEQSTWIDKRYDDYGRFVGLSYQHESVGGIWVDLDADGNPMRVHRKIHLTAEQLVQKFGDDAPKKAREAMTGDNPRRGDRFEILHVIERNRKRREGRIDAAGMPWIACYYCVTGVEIFREGGHRTMRRVVSRFERAGSSNYGWAPAMRALTSTRGSQVIMQDRVLATEMALKRPMLAVDDELDEAIVDMSPWGITYGGLDDMGRKRLEPMFDAPDLAGAKDLHQDQYSIIDRVFYRHVMQLNREMKTHIPAARILEEIAEKGILLSPLARQEGWWFAPMLECELDLIWEEGFLDDMPPALREYFGNGGPMATVYDNNLTRMQEANDAVGILRTGEQVAVFAQFDPSAPKAFAREFPMSRVIAHLAGVNGVPAKLRATDDEKRAFDNAEQQEANLQQMLQVAPVIADAAANASQAGMV